MFASRTGFRSCQIHPSVILSPVRFREAVISEPAPEERPSLAQNEKVLGTRRTRERDRRVLWEISTSPKIKTVPLGRVVMRNADPGFRPGLSRVAPPVLLGAAQFFLALKCLAHRRFRRNFHTSAIPQSRFNLQNRPKFHYPDPHCTNPSSPACGCPALHSKHATYSRKVFIDSKNRRYTNTIVLRHL